MITCISSLILLFKLIKLQDIDNGPQCSDVFSTADSTVSTGDIWLDDPVTDIKIGSVGGTAEVTLSVNNDEEVEDTEYLGICLNSIIGANGGTLPSVSIAVTDDDRKNVKCLVVCFSSLCQ